MTRRFILFLLGGTAFSLLFFLGLHLATREYEIASFSTSLEGRNPSQIRNIRLGASRIDGSVILPGEIFSFNQTVGERLLCAGYRKAPAIWEGRIEEEKGGGLCQLSSTIYNAALLADLLIVERWPHLLVVSSVGPGRDATVEYGKCDLRFRNPFKFPIRLSIDITSARLCARIMAGRKPDRQVQVLTEDMGSPVHASGVPESGSHIVRVFRIVSTKGEKKKEFISEDRYAASGRR